MRVRILEARRARMLEATKMQVTVWIPEDGQDQVSDGAHEAAQDRD